MKHKITSSAVAAVALLIPGVAVTTTGRAAVPGAGQPVGDRIEQRYGFLSRVPRSVEAYGAMYALGAKLDELTKTRFWREIAGVTACAQGLAQGAVVLQQAEKDATWKRWLNVAREAFGKEFFWFLAVLCG